MEPFAWFLTCVEVVIWLAFTAYILWLAYGDRWPGGPYDRTGLREECLRLCAGDSGLTYHEWNIKFHGKCFDCKSTALKHKKREINIMSAIWTILRWFAVIVLVTALGRWYWAWAGLPSQSDIMGWLRGC